MAASDSRRIAGRTPRRLFAFGLMLAVLASACGSSAVHGNARRTIGAGALEKLRGVAPPPGWALARSRVGAATLAAPTAWHRVPGDPGSVTLELGRHPDRPVGYLNATPAVAGERLRSWVVFRVRHNREEGDRQVRLLDARRGVRFGDGSVATCVQDAYSTSTARYIEIACLAHTASARTVIVAASPHRTWSREQATLTRAIDAFASSPQRPA